MAGYTKILGNEKNIAHLTKAIASGKLSHAYIINGPEGSGKKTLAMYMAAALLCSDPKVSQTEAGRGVAPCGMCSSCIKAFSGNHPDIIRTVHEKPNVLTVGELREQVINDVAIGPYYGPYKVYIIEDAHLMNENGQNAILKTIEEPPAYAIFLLLTDNADILMDTIRSRTVRLEMDMLERDVIKGRLTEKGVPEDEAAEIAAFVKGNLGRALELAEGRKLKSLLDETCEFLRNILTADALEIFQISESLGKQDYKEALEAVRSWFRDVLVVKSLTEQAEPVGKEELYFPGEMRILKEQATAFSFEGLGNVFTDIDTAGDNFKGAVKPEAVFENLFLRIRRNGKSSRS